MTLLFGDFVARTVKDTPAYRRRLVEDFGFPYRSDNAPSWWNRLQRQQERRRASQELANRREPQPIYHRPYYW